MQLPKIGHRKKKKTENKEKWHFMSQTVLIFLNAKMDLRKFTADLYDKDSSLSSQLSRVLPVHNIGGLTDTSDTHVFTRQTS